MFAFAHDKVKKTRRNKSIVTRLERLPVRIAAVGETAQCLNVQFNRIAHTSTLRLKLQCQLGCMRVSAVVYPKSVVACQSEKRPPWASGGVRIAAMSLARIVALLSEPIRYSPGCTVAMAPVIVCPFIRSTSYFEVVSMPRTCFQSM